MATLDQVKKAAEAERLHRAAFKEAADIQAYLSKDRALTDVIGKLDDALALAVYVKTLPAPGPEPEPQPQPQPQPQPSGKGLWVDARALGAPPSGIVSIATGSWGTPDVSNQDGSWNTAILAAALVAIKNGDSGLRSKVVQGLEAVVGKDSGARALALGRMVPAVVIAADLVGHHSPKFDGWLKSMLDSNREGHGGADSLFGTALKSTNNWGTHARAACAAITLHVGETARTKQVATAHRRWLGETNNHVMTWNDTNWHAHPDKSGVNRPGASIQGHDVSGVQPEDQRRGGEFKWPVPAQNYVSGGLGGAIVADVILTRAGLVPAKHVSNAIARASKFATLDGDDAWQRPVLRKLYGVTDKPGGGGRGKVMAHTEWTHG